MKEVELGDGIVYEVPDAIHAKFVELQDLIRAAYVEKSEVPAGHRILGWVIQDREHPNRLGVVVNGDHVTEDELARYMVDVSLGLMYEYGRKSSARSNLILNKEN